MLQYTSRSYRSWGNLSIYYDLADNSKLKRLWYVNQESLAWKLNNLDWKIRNHMTSTASVIYIEFFYFFLKKLMSVTELSCRSDPSCCLYTEQKPFPFRVFSSYSVRAHRFVGHLPSLKSPILFVLLSWPSSALPPLGHSFTINSLSACCVQLDLVIRERCLRRKTWHVAPHNPTWGGEPLPPQWGANANLLQPAYGKGRQQMNSEKRIMGEVLL